MRPYYPFESDYAATVGSSNKNINSESLMLHGRYMKEYLNSSKLAKVNNFKEMHIEVIDAINLLYPLKH